MSNRSLYLLLGTIGSIVGGYLPAWFGVSDFSPWTILWGTIGGVAGVWLGYKLANG